MKKILSVGTLLVFTLLFAGVGCISFGGGNKVAGSGPAGVFASIDKGETWQQISIMPTVEKPVVLSDVQVYRIVDDPQDPRTMYWLSRGQGMYYTYNDGKSWQKVEGPLSTGFIYSAAVHPEDKCTVYATNGVQVFKTDDCSRSWVEMYRESRSDVRLSSLAFDPRTSNRIFLTETSGDILFSDDGGANWRALARLNTNIEQIVADPTQANTWYLATRVDGIFRSTDGGLNWTSLADKLGQYSGGLEYRRFVVHPTKPGVLYWISTYGILVSQDRGNNWKAMTLITPPGSAAIYGFAVNPKNDNEIYYTATINDRSTFYKSVDGGQRWMTKKMPSDQLPVVLRVHPMQENIVYLGFTVPPKQ